MADDKPNILKPKRKKRLRKVVVREKAEYRGFFRLDEKDKQGKSIHRIDKDGLAVYVYQLSWKDQHGNRKQKREYCRDDDEAKKKLRAYRNRVDEILKDGAPKTPTVETFAEFARRDFLPYQKNRISSTVAKGRISATEYARQEGIIGGYDEMGKPVGHLVPFFGKMQLAAIQISDVLDYVNKRMGDTVRGGGKVSDATILKERNVLRALLNLARAKGRIFTNPAAGGIELRQALPRQPDGRVRWLKTDEWKAVFAACYIEPSKEDPNPVQWLQQFAGLSIALGCRRGELLAVTVPDIDFENGVITLRKTKNGKSRSAYLNDLAIQVLDAMGIRERQAKKDRGKLWQKQNLDPSNVSMKFIRACRAAGVEDFSLHDLRHTYASWLRMKGADLQDLKELLGHRDLRMTDRYTHLSAAHLSANAQRLNGLFNLSEPVSGEEPKALPALVEGS